MDPMITIIAIFVLVIYFIPTGVACIRKTKRDTGIFLLNLFLGWTLLGWVGSLVWAVSDNKKENK